LYEDEEDRASVPLGETLKQGDSDV
jgi:hypothetical protein